MCFKCGGLVIGCYMLHKLLDATSFCCFLNYWASLAGERHRELVKPDFEATVSAFPPSPIIQQPLSVAKTQSDSNPVPDDGEDISKLWKRLNAIKVVGKSFVLSNIAIEKLKAKAASEVVPNPTRFETVAGFVWHHIMSAAQPDASSELKFIASIRARTIPPLPKQSMGNLIVDVVTCSDKCGELADHVKEIHAAVLTVEGKVEKLQGENAAEMYRIERESGLQSLVKDRRATSYTLTSWCRLGITEVNFGFGKPDQVIPVGIVNPFLRNSMTFLDYSDPNNGDGIEVWLFLEEKQMQLLQSSEQFCAFAT